MKVTDGVLGQLLRLLLATCVNQWLHKEIIMNSVCMSDITLERLSLSVTLTTSTPVQHNGSAEWSRDGTVQQHFHNDTFL